MKNKFYLITLILFVLGIIGGIMFPSFFVSISFLGTIYVNLLKLMIVPILFCGIASAVYKSVGKTSKIVIKTIILFVLMFVVSFVLMFGLFSLIQPGTGFTFNEIAWEGTLTTASISGFLTSIIPSNIIVAMSENAMLPVILFAFVLGLAAAKSKSERAMEVVESFGQIFNKMLEYIMYLTPIGVFALIGNMIATNGLAVLSACGIYIGMAYLGCLVVAILVMVIPVWIYAKISPIQYIKNIYKIWLITLSTRSSAATLPHTIKVCNENFNIPKEITDLVVPLGCTIHMCGGAVSFCLLAVFTAQFSAITITFPLFLLMLVFATLINMAAPGIPGGGIVIGATYLTLLGFPISFIGVYAGIYVILDMIYTTMNVNGDITANILIAKSENLL